MNVDTCDANYNPLSVANVSETHNEISRLQMCRIRISDYRSKNFLFIYSFKYVFFLHTIRNTKTNQ